MPANSVSSYFHIPGNQGESSFNHFHIENGVVESLSGEGHDRSEKLLVRSILKNRQNDREHEKEHQDCTTLSAISVL